MDIKELRYFISVARSGNITKSAEKLYITQPTLSRSLASLENELGVHYASDVIAGFLISISYLVIYINIVDRLIEKLWKNS